MSFDEELRRSLEDHGERDAAEVQARAEETRLREAARDDLRSAARVLADSGVAPVRLYLRAKTVPEDLSIPLIRYGPRRPPALNYVDEGDPTTEGWVFGRFGTIEGVKAIVREGRLVHAFRVARGPTDRALKGEGSPVAVSTDDVPLAYCAGRLPREPSHPPHVGPLSPDSDGDLVFCIAKPFDQWLAGVVTGILQG